MVMVFIGYCIGWLLISLFKQEFDITSFNVNLLINLLVFNLLIQAYRLGKLSALVAWFLALGFIVINFILALALG
ncbi:hypothetical protein [Aerococcus urinaehominis]|nr:hypothetical protein [Aerococcus urinaehominis]